MMADMGADVVKVEPPTGDFYRGHLAAQRGEGRNFNFEFENRGKRSISLDLTQPGASEVVKRLAEKADVLITNLIRERVERYDLGFEELRARNPRLVYASISGYGARGPEADKPGFDASSFWAAVRNHGDDRQAGGSANRESRRAGRSHDGADGVGCDPRGVATARSDQTRRSSSMSRSSGSAYGRSLATFSSSSAACPRAHRWIGRSRASSPGTRTGRANDRWLMLVMVNPQRKRSHGTNS